MLMLVLYLAVVVLTEVLVLVSVGLVTLSFASKVHDTC